MQRRHRTIFLLVIALAFTQVACRNKREIHAAKHSLYDADFAVVYSAALAAVRENYANLDDYPQNGMIKTAWHQVSYANNQDDLANPRTVAAGQGVPTTGAGQAVGATGVPTRLAYKRHFIRFDVRVIGGRPWRVKVIGYAAEWDPGNAMPTELRGPARPPWLDGRIEAMQVAIYRKVKKHAVPMKEVVVETTEPDIPKTDPTTIKGVPDGAARVLATIKDAVGRRDHVALRGALADDVVWSLGGAPGADTAMAMWQADPETLDAMGRVIAGGCGGDGAKVSCPAGAPVPGAWQLVLEPRAGAWRATSYVRAE